MRKNKRKHDWGHGEDELAWWITQQKPLLSTYCVPSSVLGAKNISVRQTSKFLAWRSPPLDGMRQSTTGAGAWSGDYCYDPARGQKASIQLVVVRKERREWWDSNHWKENSKGEKEIRFSDIQNTRLLEKVVAMTCSLVSAFIWLVNACQFLWYPKGWSLKAGATITVRSICLNVADWRCL